MNDLFVKRGTPDTSSLLGEAAALRWLAEAEAAGGMPIAEVVSVSDAELVERQVKPGPATRQAADCVGTALAITHAAGAPWWGAPPTGWQGSYLIAHTATPTIREADAPSIWGAFFAEFRIMPYLLLAADAKVLDSNEVAVFERVAERLKSGDFEASQPAMLSAAGTGVARIHGDLWSGNLLWSSDPANPVGAALIDPMAHGGHAETDLAMLALFGCPHLDRIVAAYDEASSLAYGWRDRIALHQLAPLLHHCALFGRSYAAQALAAAKPYM
ncbi:MAG: fructosamine kinase family protein [Eggerthellaceae bacterium]|nr:fructosamine kinase family protein [Eggerthellaceae bacterium]